MSFSDTDQDTEWGTFEINLFGGIEITSWRNSDARMEDSGFLHRMVMEFIGIFLLLEWIDPIVGSLR